MSNYRRVIPRDLFNEAGLLKAVGRVAILLGETDHHHAKLSTDQVDSFDIVQDESSGNIRIANVGFSIGGRNLFLERPLNTRASWSLEMRPPDYSEDAIEVFTEEGNFTPEMLEAISIGMDDPSVKEEGFYIYSANEASVDEYGAGWWSNDTGWVDDPADATCFTADETTYLNLPMSTGNDATWVASDDIPEFGMSAGDEIEDGPG